MVSSFVRFKGVTCIQQYITEDTKATLSVQPTGDTTFIAFTICPDFINAYKTDLLQSKYGKVTIIKLLSRPKLDN